MNNLTLRKLSARAVLIALSVILVSLIHFPVFPAVPFLEYDPADIPVLICAFAFGPLSGLIVLAFAAVIQGLTVSAGSGIYGILMHILASAALILPASLVYRKVKKRKSAVIGMCCGVVAMALVMIPANLFITPYFMGVPWEAIVPLLPWIVLFNLLKAGINSLVTFLIYKKISRLIHSFAGN